MSNTNIKINAFFNIIKSLMGILYPILTFPYAARVLSSEGIGKIEFVNSIVQFFLLFGGLGIASYGAREVARCRNNKHKLTKLIQELFLFNITTSLISYIFLFLTVAFINKFHSYYILFCISSLKILFTTLGMNWVYIGLEKYKWTSIRSVLFQFISIIFLYIFVKNKDDYIYYAFVSIIAYSGVDIVNFFLILKYLKINSLKELKPFRHFKYVLIFFGMVVAGSVYTSLDITMLGFLSDESTVGMYTAANKMNRVVLTMITAATGVLLPKVSNMLMTGNNAEHKIIFQKSIRFILLFSIPCCAGLFLLSKEIINVFCGIDYLDAVPAMKLLAIAIIPMSIASVLDSVLIIPLGKERTILFSQIIGAIINFSLNLILIRKFNLIGAVISTLVAESCVTLFQFFSVRRYFKDKQILFSLLKGILASLFILIYVNFLNIYVCVNSFLFLGISITGSIIIYFIMLFLLNESLLKELFIRNLER